MRRSNGQESPWRWLGFHAPPVGLLLLFGLLVLSPLYRASGEFPVHSIIKWDTMMLHYPRLVYASDAFHYARELPMWNPFQDFGFPYVADAQTQLWSPLTWLVIVWLQYDLFTVQWQLILTFLLAGAGAYALARCLGHRRSIAWMAGATFQFSGYLVGNAGLLGTMSTLAWFPWALCAVVRSLREPGRRVGWMALAGLLLAQCSVGGHPTTAMVGALNLAALHLLLPAPRLSGRARAGLLLLCAALCAMAVAPQLTGVLATRDFFLHYQRPVLEQVEKDALLPGALLSLLVPDAGLSTVGTRLGSYPSGIPCYAGLLTLLGLGLALGRARWPRPLRALAALAAINLFLALGPASALRQALYFWMPGMDGPHNASMDFRGFAILFGTLGACHGWSLLLAALRRRHPAVRLAVRGLLVGSTVLGAGGLVLLVIGAPRATATAPDMPLAEMLLLQSLTAGAGVFLVALAARTNRRNAALLLCVFVAFDMGSAAKRCWPLVADRLDARTAEFVADVEFLRPRSFRPLQFITFDDEFPHFDGFVVHHVDLDGYNPPLKLRSPDDPRTIRELGRDFWFVLPHRAAPLTEDGRWLRKGRVTLGALTPNTMTWSVTGAPEGSRLLVLSSWFPGWTCRVGDGPAVPVARSSAGPHFLDAVVPSGNSTVVFRFQPSWVWPSVWVMLLGYLVGAVLIVWGLGRRRPRGATRGPLPAPDAP